MQNQHNPVLIFAQSGRFLAQSATQAGYSVWVADCFGDQDTLSIADRWLKVPPLIHSNHDALIRILSELSQGENCSLICGTGIESCYSLLDKLPPNIQLTGNSAPTIHAIKTPSLFFGLLDQLGLRYPTTQFERPNNNKDWLMKSASGLGGNHIQYLNLLSPTDNYYFQKRIGGTSGSVLFLTDGKGAQLVSINKQIISCNKESPFRLAGIETPWEIAETHQQYLKKALGEISKATGLIGLNSLDFMISDQNELLILEVNPRPSASAELIDIHEYLFQHHYNACQGILPSESISISTDKTSLRYLFADANYSIPENMSWPIECHDIPKPNSQININEPICTSVVYSNSELSSDILHGEIEKKVLQQLLLRPAK